MNHQALLLAFLATAIIGVGLYLTALDEDCDLCGHSRWMHGDKVCAGEDRVSGGNFSTSRSCNCTHYKEPK